LNFFFLVYRYIDMNEYLYKLIYIPNNNNNESKKNGIVGIIPPTTDWSDVLRNFWWFLFCCWHTAKFNFFVYMIDESIAHVFWLICDSDMRLIDDCQNVMIYIFFRVFFFFLANLNKFCSEFILTNNKINSYTDFSYIF
jgi:hypothetical protein